MNALRIRGGRRLEGEWTIHSAKNAVLPILAASILSHDKTVLTGCPDLSDVRYMGEILQTLGCRVQFERGSITVDPQSL